MRRIRFAVLAALLAIAATVATTRVAQSATASQSGDHVVTAIVRGSDVVVVTRQGIVYVIPPQGTPSVRNLYLR